MADARVPRWMRWTALGCGVAVLAAGTYLVLDPASSAAATEGLRTATVTTGSVTQAVDLSGSVQRVDQVAAGFRTAGKVTAVRVDVGDTVTAGQVIARIDDAALQRAVTVKQADLVAAQAALDAAESGTSTTTTQQSSATTSDLAGSAATTPSASTSSPSATPSPTSGSPGSTPGGAGGPGGPGGSGGTVDTGSLSAATSQTEKLLARARTVCQPVLGDVGTGGPPGSGPSPSPSPTPTPSATASSTPTPSTTPSASASATPTLTPTPTDSASPTPTAPSTPTDSASPTPTATPTPSASATATPTPSSTPSPSPSASSTPTTSPSPTPTSTDTGPTAAEVSACVAALTDALLATDRAGGTLTRLADLLDAAATAVQQQQSTADLRGTGTTGSPSGSGSLPSSSGQGGQGVGSTASLEVDVLQATQALASAQQDLDGATLRAPIDGTVASLDFAVGEQESTSDQVVIVGKGAATVTVDVPLAQLGMLRVSQPVVVTPAGTSTELDGLVASIGVLPTSTTSSTPTYPVVVTVSDAPITLATGSTATTHITLSQVDNVLTVPVSALSGLSAGAGSVQVVDAGSVSTARVEVGAVGDGRAAVDNGLSLGQVVVIADPSQALPTSGATTGRGGGLGGGGGFVRGGFGGRPGG